MPTITEDAFEALLDELILPTDGANTRRVLSYLRDDDPDTIVLAHRLVTTGCDEARRDASSVLAETLSTIANTEYLFADDESWRDKCQSEWSPHIKHKLLATWHSSQLVDEVDPSGTLGHKLVPVTVVAFHTYTQRGTPLHEEYSGMDSYWRGLSALVLTGLEVKKRYDSDFSSFIQLAGVHSDIGRLINLASERGTLNAEVLEGIMREQDNLPKAVSRGTL